MSILIKGMEMPTCCCVCPCFNDEYCYCQAADKDLGSIPIDHRHPDCPLVSVPPHGRLIDADVLKACWKDTFFEEMVQILIQTVPTVISADKDGET